METLKTLSIKTELTEQAIRVRVKNLGLPDNYSKLNGRPVRVFTEEEADKVINFKRQKPGRKRIK